MTGSNDPQPLISVHTRPVAAVAAAFLLGLFATLAISSMVSKSVTGDEVAHLPAGYSYLVTNDFRLNRQHPPLAKALAGLPLLFLDLEPIEETAGWVEADEWLFGRVFLTENSVPMDRVLLLARLPMVGIGVLTGLIVFIWSFQLWGPRTALIVLFFYSLSPNILAHTRLVNTDMGATCGAVATMYCLWRYLQTHSLWWATSCGLALGLALLAKYSGVVTVAAALMVLGLAVVLRVGIGWRAAVIAATVMLAVAASVVVFGFGFPHGFTNYINGMRLIYADSNPAWEAYLWGEYSKTGFRSYYLFAQLWKTPLPTLLLLVAALVTFRVRHRQQLVGLAVIMTPIVAFHAAGYFNQANIGVRHILPVFPFILLACGFAIDRAFVSRWRTAGLVLLCAWYAAGSLAAYPHFLPYFNELAGGSAGGPAYLDDSNVEWGQDLGLVATLLAEQSPPEARIFAFEPLPRSAYGIEAESVGLRDLVWPQPNVEYLMGASLLRRSSVYSNCPGVRAKWSDRYQPVSNLGWSILVYRFTADPTVSARGDAELIEPHEWYSNAIKDLQDIAGRCPQLAQSRQILAEVFAHRAGWREQRGELPAAAADAARAVINDPQQGAYRERLRGLVLRADTVQPIGDLPEGEYDRALSAARDGEVAQALESLLVCLAADPDRVPVRFSLGSLLEGLGLPELARQQWTTALAIDPDHDLTKAALRRLDGAPQVTPSIPPFSTGLARRRSESQLPAR